jgi:hypothetical protein
MKGVKAIWIVLWLCLLGVLLSHVGLQADENGHLLNLDGRLIDVVGEWSQLKTKFSRNCDSVQTLILDQPMSQAALRAVQSYSPPDSSSAHLQSLIQEGEWLLAEVQFESLLPAVIMLHQSGGRLELLDQSIWSGSTAPWKAAPRIRAYLRQSAPKESDHLIECFDAHHPSFDN